MHKDNKKSSEPEYPLQKELEGSLDMDYKKMLLAMGVETLNLVTQSLVDNSKQK